MKNKNIPFEWHFLCGNITIKSHNLNELKDFVCELAKKTTSTDYSNKISDFIFAVESQYQSHYRLDQDNWDQVHNK